jgi:hypothetical protein
LTGLTLNYITDATTTSAVLNVYRDSINPSNLVGSGSAATAGGITIDLTTGTASKEIANGSTVIFYVELL